jgi:hypothetical protein
MDSADLKSQLFRSPGMLASIRMEAADRFLRWREVHRVRNLSTLSVGSSVQVGGGFGGGISGGRPLNPFTVSNLCPLGESTLTTLPRIDRTFGPVRV